MYLLDTNVLSELMKSKPAQSVISWMDEQNLENLFTTSVTKAEIGLGLALLPDGKRKKILSSAIDQMMQEFLPDRCLSFDHFAAEYYGNLSARRINSGRPISVEDAQIAAIALVHKLIHLSPETVRILKIL